MGPGVFTTSVTTNAGIATEKATWEDNVRRYNEYQLLESTLKNQFVGAFDSEYFDGIRNSTANAVEKPIAEIIQYLYDKYSEMTPEQMMDKEEEIKRYVFDPVQPIYTVFNAITTYKDLCELSGESITDSMMVKISYAIMNRSRVFKDSLIQWNDKTLVDKTWVNFQQHFRKAYKDLKRVNALGIQDSQVSKVEMMQELERHQAEIISEVKQHVTDTFYQCMSASSLPNEVEQEEYNQANGVVTINAKELQELRKLVTDLKNHQLTPQANNNNDNKQNVLKYCWAHGAYSYVGQD